jgi:hypothetical protein
MGMGYSADARIIYGFHYEDDDSTYDDVEAWWAEHQGLSDPEECPVCVTYSGDMLAGCTRSFLVIRESMLDGWYNGTEIPVGHVKEPPPEWDELLKKFCDSAGIPFSQPKWQLISSYG